MSDFATNAGSLILATGGMGMVALMAVVFYGRMQWRAILKDIEGN